MWRLHAGPASPLTFAALAGQRVVVIARGFVPAHHAQLLLPLQPHRLVQPGPLEPLERPVLPVGSREGALAELAAAAHAGPVAVRGLQAVGAERGRAGLGLQRWHRHCRVLAVRASLEILLQLVVDVLR